MKVTYIIGLTTYDNDHQLWETHIGNEDTLYLSAWGKTEQESRQLAENILRQLPE